MIDLKKSSRLALALALALASNVAKSQEINNVPDEFSDMFSGEVETFDFMLSGSNDNIKIDLVTTPLSAKLESTQFVNKVKKYLEINGILSKRRKEIVSEMMQQIRNSEQCIGVISECNIIPKDFQFAYDYDRKKLILFVNSSFVDFSEKDAKNVNSRNSNAGLINSFNIDLGYYGDDITFNLRDESIIGLLYGNVNSKFYASNDDFDIEQLSYNYEWDKNRLQVGRYKYSYIDNSTNVLNLPASNSQEVITLSSSRNLTSSGQSNERKLSYFLPSSGKIEVYRDDKLILSKNVSSGQQYIYFNDLPKGNYQATVIVSSSGKQILKEEQQIYNSSSFKLKKGDVDYSVTTGHFDKKDYFDDRGGELESQIFIDSRISGQVTDSTLLATGLTSTGKESLISIGIVQDILDVADFTAQLAFFDNSSKFYSIYGSLYGFSLGYEKYSQDIEGNSYSLDQYLLSDNGYTRITANKSIDILGGNGYLTYINNKSSDEKKDSSVDALFDYWSLSLGYNRQFLWDTNLDISFSYQGNDEDDSYSAAILWDIPLGDSWRAKSLVSAGDYGFDEFRNSILNEIEGDDYSGYSELGVSYSNLDSEVKTDLSIGGNITKEAYSTDMYAYLESTGSKSLNVNLSSTQIFDGDKVYFTSEKSDSYIVINADNHNDVDNHRGLLTVSRNNTRFSKNIDSEKSVIPIEKYNTYSAKLDTASTNYVENGDSAQVSYSFPGSVISVNTDLTKIKTFITSFEDIQSRKINEVKCLGDGCIGIETISDGVFKVSVVAGSDFELVSNNQTCVTPTLVRNSTKISNVGLNYCLPGNDELLAKNEIQLGNKRYYFIGVFTDRIALGNVEKRLQREGYKNVSRKVGNREYLYIESDTILTVNQINNLENVSRYAQSKSLNNQKFALWR